jgi:outer membrane protein assembly factor BamA
VSADPESVLAITEAELRQKFKIEKGVPLSIDKIRKGVEGAIRTYGDRGFIDATIIPAFSVDYKSHVVEVTMRVSEGRKYFVEKFEVLGVDGKTKTAIEARVKPGSVFDNALMEELFNQGKVASSRDVSYMNITNVTRNPEKATVDIVFDFRLCPR